MARNYEIEANAVEEVVHRDPFTREVSGFSYVFECEWLAPDGEGGARLLFAFPYRGPDQNPTPAEIAHALAVDFSYIEEECGGDWLQEVANRGEKMTAEDLREVRDGFERPQEWRAALEEEYGAEWVRGFIERHREED